MRVGGMIRVSTDDQSKEGVSLPHQATRVRGYCALHDHTLVPPVRALSPLYPDLFVDDASGKSLDRPGMQALLTAARDGLIEGIVITALDRITRNVQDGNRLIDEYFGDRPSVAPVALMSVNDHIDTKTAAGRLVLNILVVVAQWQREYIVETTRGALSGKIQRGERVGAVPYGFRLDPNGRCHPDHERRGVLMDLVPDEREQEELAWIVFRHSCGASLRQIATELNQRGVPTKRGRGPWVHSSIARILERKALPAPTLEGNGHAQAG